VHRRRRSDGDGRGAGLTDSPQAGLTVEPTGSSDGICECCGHESRTVWGFVHSESETIAYFAHWTVGRLDDHPGNLDFIIGRWGEGTSEKDRAIVSLLYDHVADTPQVMVVDARAERGRSLASSRLNRKDVVGTRLAERVFELVDAVCVQDKRAFTD
jgi:hypothetical protein